MSFKNSISGQLRKNFAALEADLSYTAEVGGGILGAQDPLRYPDRILSGTSSNVIHL
jgi:hypothetical protein